MPPQPSEKCGHCSPDHHCIYSPSSYSISLKQARGVFTVLRGLFTPSYADHYKSKTVPGTIYMSGGDHLFAL